MHKVDMVKEFEKHFYKSDKKFEEVLTAFSDCMNAYCEKGYNDTMKEKEGVQE